MDGTVDVSGCVLRGPKALAAEKATGLHWPPDPVAGDLAGHGPPSERRGQVGGRSPSGRVPPHLTTCIALLGAAIVATPSLAIASTFQEEILADEDTWLDSLDQYGENCCLAPLMSNGHGQNLYVGDLGGSRTALIHWDLDDLADYDETVCEVTGATLDLRCEGGGTSTGTVWVDVSWVEYPSWNASSCSGSGCTSWNEFYQYGPNLSYTDTWSFACTTAGQVEYFDVTDIVSEWFENDMGDGNIALEKSSSSPAGAYRVFYSSDHPNEPELNVDIECVDNLPPNSPAVNAPSSGTQNSAVSVSVTTGSDPNGDSVQAVCWSTGSNHSSSSPWTSNWVAGGTVVSASFTWSSTGSKVVTCHTADSGGLTSGTATDSINILGVAAAPSPPNVNAPSSGTTGSPISVSVTTGTDPNGDSVRAVCWSSGATNYSSSSSPWTSSWVGGGSTVSGSFAWNSAGTKTVTCFTEDYGGLTSVTDSDTISISIPPGPPSTPTVNAPFSGIEGSPVTISVTTGTDPNGQSVKAVCWSVGSNYPTNGNTWDSSYVSGGSTVSGSFTWTSSGTRTVTCYTEDIIGMMSANASDTISIGAAAAPPTTPTVSAPSSGSVGVAVSVSVTAGTDPNGDSVRAVCWSSGSNYASSSSPWTSSWVSGGSTVSGSFTWNSVGTKTVTCYTEDTGGLDSGNDSDTINLTDPPVAPTAPSVSAPSSGTTGSPVTISVTTGTDANGDSVHAVCWSSGSDYPSSSSPWTSSWVSSGSTVSASFTWTNDGNHTVTCHTEDTTGLTSGNDSDTITTGSVPTSPDPPSVNAPASGDVGTPVAVSVTAGSDPNGDSVRVVCWSADSNYANSSSPWTSSWVSGGDSVSASLTWSADGTKTITCYTEDIGGLASANATDAIAINDVQAPPSAPTVIAPSSGALNDVVSVSVATGTDPNGDSVRAVCWSADSNYASSSSAWTSNFVADGNTVTGSFVWSDIGSMTVTCYTEDLGGLTSSNASDDITIVGEEEAPPSAPTVNAPDSGTVGMSVSISVTTGTDPDGDLVRAVCWSADSSYPDSGDAWYSSWAGGGSSVSASFSWSSGGTKTVTCYTEDDVGLTSGTASDTIDIESTGDDDDSTPGDDDDSQDDDDAGPDDDDAGFETGSAACSDGQDNDADGLTDCDDPACDAEEFCQERDNTWREGGCSGCGLGESGRRSAPWAGSVGLLVLAFRRRRSSGACG